MSARPGVQRNSSSYQEDIESPLLELYSPRADAHSLAPSDDSPARLAMPLPRLAGLSRADVLTNKRKAYYSYAGDWVLTIVIAGVFYSLDKIHGYWRHFSLTDTTIQYPFAEHERVPNWALYLIALLAPFILIPVINVLTIRHWWDWHHGWLGLLLSFATTGALTQVVKVTVGRPRPDLINRCLPAAGSENASPFGLASAAICTSTNMAILKDGFRSFPSGHSSLSFAGLGFLSWYLAGKLHLFDRRGHTFKAWISITPLVGALLVAISRTMDNRHHWQDVTVGSIMGIAFSFFAYRQYYPPLSAPDAHLPFEARFMRPAVPSPFAGENGNGTHENRTSLPVITDPRTSRGYRDAPRDDLESDVGRPR